MHVRTHFPIYTPQRAHSFWFWLCRNRAAKLVKHLVLLPLASHIVHYVPLDFFFICRLVSAGENQLSLTPTTKSRYEQRTFPAAFPWFRVNRVCLSAASGCSERGGGGPDWEPEAGQRAVRRAARGVLGLAGPAGVLPGLRRAAHGDGAGGDERNRV